MGLIAWYGVPRRLVFGKIQVNVAVDRTPHVGLAVVMRIMRCPSDKTVAIKGESSHTTQADEVHLLRLAVAQGRQKGESCVKKGDVVTESRMSWRFGKRFLRCKYNCTSNLRSCDNFPHPPRKASYGQYMMAVDGASNAHAVDRTELRQALVTSSTKRRISELSGLQHQFGEDCKSHEVCAGSVLYR